MLRISARASRTTPAEHHGQTSGGAVHPVYAAHAGQPTGQDMLHTLTDQVHFPAEKRAPRFTMASSTTGRFSHLHRASRGDRFPSRPGESGALAGQQRLTACGQRRPDTPRTSATRQLTLHTASRTASRTA